MKSPLKGEDLGVLEKRLKENLFDPDYSGELFFLTIMKDNFRISF